jgi:hypothetical protein
MAEHKKTPRRDPSSSTGWQVDTISPATGGDQVTWTAPVGADATIMTIWFPPDPKWDPLGIGTVTLQPGKSVTKSVPRGARKDHYHYSVFCHKDGKMAEGPNSPPEMIIDP